MAKYGVILSNIGTPRSTRSGDVAKYLREFLMDPYVLDIPWFTRFLLVNGIIAPFRAPKSAKKYKEIWQEKGSPLMINTQEYAKALEAVLGEEFKVVIGMRYGSPSMEDAVQRLLKCDQIVLFPQYPQYAESSTRTCVEKFQRVVAKMGYKKSAKAIPSFFCQYLLYRCLDLAIGKPSFRR